jgi:hypothetical protein
MAHRRESDTRGTNGPGGAKQVGFYSHSDSGGIEANLASLRNRTPIRDLAVLFGRTATDEGFGSLLMDETQKTSLLLEMLACFR